MLSDCLTVSWGKARSVPMRARACVLEQRFPDFNVHVDHGGSRGDGQWLMSGF